MENTVFKDPKDRQVKHYYPKKKAVTLSTGSGQKEILMAQRNPGEGVLPCKWLMGLAAG